MKYIYALACGSNFTIVSYPSCVINGVKFLTTEHDERVMTQNSGVCVLRTKNNTFYGQLEDII